MKMAIKGVFYVTFRVSSIDSVKKYAIRCNDEDQARDIAMNVFSFRCARYVRISKKPHKEKCMVRTADEYLNGEVKF